MATKSTRTRRITRRPLHPPSPTLPSSSCPPITSDARPPTPIPGYHTQHATTSATVVAYDGDTERVHSEAAEPSTSAVTLEDSFPFSSILPPIRLLDEAFHRNDSAAFWHQANFLASQATEIASDIAKVQQVNPSQHVDPTWEGLFILAKLLVRLLLDGFEVSRGDHESPRNRQDAFEYAKMILDSLALFYRCGQLLHLPRDRIGRLELSEYTKLIRESLGLFCRCNQLASAQSLGTSYLSATDPIKRTRTLRSQRRKDGSTRSIVKRRSSLPNLKVDNYNQRHTILFFGEAKMPSTFSCVGERPEGFKLNKPGNRVRAVSLSSLVSIITSAEGATNPDLVQALLASFRLFMTPDEFFEALKERFETKTPTDPKQLDTKVSDIRANVLAIIYSWLDQHWQVESDSVVLGRIRAFVEEQAERDSHNKLRSLFAKIRAREECSDEDVQHERSTLIASTSPAKTHPDRTKFIFPRFDPPSHDLLRLDTDDGREEPSRHLTVKISRLYRRLQPTKFLFPRFDLSSNALLWLDNDDGREELSRHLTIKMSRLYQRLDPSKVVKFWYEAGESCREYKKFENVPCVKDLAAISAYGEQLTLWIISSILEIEEIKLRGGRISLWVNVASRCMAHRDYATAHNIYAALSYSAVFRLKETILRIPDPIKSQYWTLEDFFNKKEMVKASFNDLGPSILPTPPLIKDILHAKLMAEKDSKESATDPSSKQKFIFLEECRVAHQAIRVLNKAHIEYKFHENLGLTQWLEHRLQEFCSIHTKIIYEQLAQMSSQREPKQNRIENAWRYTNCSYRKLVGLDVKVLEQEKNAFVRSLKQRIYERYSN